MKLEKINKNIKKNAKARLRKKKIEFDLQSIEKEYDLELSRFKEIKLQLDNKRMELKRLERLSLKALCLMFTGNRTNEIEKKKYEILPVQKKYKTAKAAVEDLEGTITSHRNELSYLSEIEEERLSLLEEKEKLLNDMDHPVADQLKHFLWQLDEINSKYNKVKKAIDSWKIAIKDLQQAIEILEKSVDWTPLNFLLSRGTNEHAAIEDASVFISRFYSKTDQLECEYKDEMSNNDENTKLGKFGALVYFLSPHSAKSEYLQSEIDDAIVIIKSTEKRTLKIVEALNDKLNTIDKKRIEIQERRLQMIEKA